MCFFFSFQPVESQSRMNLICSLWNLVPVCFLLPEGLFEHLHSARTDTNKSVTKPIEGAEETSLYCVLNKNGSLASLAHNTYAVTWGSRKGVFCQWRLCLAHSLAGSKPTVLLQSRNRTANRKYILGKVCGAVKTQQIPRRGQFTSGKRFHIRHVVISRFSNKIICQWSHRIVCIISSPGFDLTALCQFVTTPQWERQWRHILLLLWGHRGNWYRQYGIICKPISNDHLMVCRIYGIPSEDLWILALVLKVGCSAV